MADMPLSPLSKLLLSLMKSNLFKTSQITILPQRPSNFQPTTLCVTWGKILTRALQYILNEFSQHEKQLFDSYEVGYYTTYDNLMKSRLIHSRDLKHQFYPNSYSYSSIFSSKKSDISSNGDVGHQQHICRVSNVHCSLHHPTVEQTMAQRLEHISI